jgi:RHS repeat-associated protein
VLVRYVYGDGTDQVLTRTVASGTSAGVAEYFTDNQGSVRDLVNASGVVKDHLDYSGFGVIVTEANAAYGDRIKYTARWFDANTGLQNNRARWYQPSTGDWLSQDPTGFQAGDSNLYRYVGNDSTNANDPMGLADELIKSVRITFDPGFPEEKKQPTKEAALLAIQKLQKALWMLTKYWDKLKKASSIEGEGGDIFIKPEYTIITGEFKEIVGCVSAGVGARGFPITKTGNLRDAYIKRLKTLLDYIKADTKPIVFRFDNDPNPKAVAYVKYWYNALGVPIYVTTKFFKLPTEGRVGILRHELGRWAGWVNEPVASDFTGTFADYYKDPSLYYYDITRFDGMIDYLARAYDRLNEK